MVAPNQEVDPPSTSEPTLTRAQAEAQMHESIEQMRRELEQSNIDLQRSFAMEIQQAMSQYQNHHLQNSAISNQPTPGPSRYPRDPFSNLPSPFSLPFPPSPPFHTAPNSSPTTMVMSAPYMTAQMPQPTIVPSVNTHSTQQPVMYHQHKFIEDPYYPDSHMMATNHHHPTTAHHDQPTVSYTKSMFTHPTYTNQAPTPFTQPHSSYYQQHTSVENPYYPESQMFHNPYYQEPLSNASYTPPYYPDHQPCSSPLYPLIPNQTHITIMDFEERDQVRTIVEQKLGLFFNPVDWCVHFDEIMGMLVERYPELRDNLSSPSPLPPSPTQTPQVFEELSLRGVDNCRECTGPEKTEVLQGEEHEFEHDKTEIQYGSTTLQEVSGLAERMASLMCVDDDLKSDSEETEVLDGSTHENGTKMNVSEIVKNEICQAKEKGDVIVRWLELEELDIDDDMLWSLDPTSKFPDLHAHSVSRKLESMWDVRDAMSDDEVNQRQKQYLVKYQELAHIHNRWLPETQLLIETPELVTKFNRKNEVVRWKADSTVPNHLLQKRLLIFPKNDDESCNGYDDNNSDCSNEWIVKVVSFIFSLLGGVCRPFLMTSTSTTISLWEAEFSQLAPSANVVVYKGNRSIQGNIRTFEFYNKRGCLMFEVLLSSPEVVAEDLEFLDNIAWEAIIVDECQRSRILRHLKQINILTADIKLLVVSGQLKGSSAEYVNLLSFLDHGFNRSSSHHLEIDTNANISVLKKILAQFIAYECKLSSFRFVEYCATLLSNSMLLRSCMKNDSAGDLDEVLDSLRKCRDQPYLVGQSLQNSVTKGLPTSAYLDVDIKLSGKLQLLDKMFLEIKSRGLRVLIIFQSIGGSGCLSVGDILDDVVYQRFGSDSYTRIHGGAYVASRKQAALDKFNKKESGRFVLLIENCAYLRSIKLSSVDTVILFDSDLDPRNDIRALERITIESQFEQLKVFRLYTLGTDDLKDVKKVLNPTEVLFVVDAMTGQEAAALVTTFNLEIGIIDVLEAWTQFTQASSWSWWIIMKASFFKGPRESATLPKQGNFNSPKLEVKL